MLEYIDIVFRFLASVLLWCCFVFSVGAAAKITAELFMLGWRVV